MEILPPDGSYIRNEGVYLILEEQNDQESQILQGEVE